MTTAAVYLRNDCVNHIESPGRLSENEIFFFKIKEGENYNRRNTLKYFEDNNFRLTQRLGKIAILGQPPIGFKKKNFGKARGRNPREAYGGVR